MKISFNNYYHNHFEQYLKKNKLFIKSINIWQKEQVQKNTEKKIIQIY